MAALTGCGQRPPGGDVRDADVTVSGEPLRVLKMQTRGRVIDTADVLSPTEEKAIVSRLAALRATKGREVVVVTLVPQGGDSMERIGWAVSGKTAGNRPILLLIDPKQASSRIEGDLTPEQRAAIAGAMQADLREERFGAAVGQGLDRLQALLS